MTIGSEVEDLGLVNTVKRKLAEITVALDGTQQVADSVAEN